MNKKIFLGLITVSLLSANRTFAQSYMTEHQLDSLENSWAAMQDTLKNVEVVAQKRIVKVESDKITYSVKDDSDAKTNNVLDMLRKVPMVTVDGQDNIKVNGSSSFYIVVNDSSLNGYKPEYETVKVTDFSNSPVKITLKKQTN